MDKSSAWGNISVCCQVIADDVHKIDTTINYLHMHEIGKVYVLRRGQVLVEQKQLQRKKNQRVSLNR